VCVRVCVCVCVWASTKEDQVNPKSDPNPLN
jgi:hypothetical protein